MEGCHGFQPKGNAGADAVVLVPVPDYQSTSSTSCRVSRVTSGITGTTGNTYQYRYHKKKTRLKHASEFGVSSCQNRYRQFRRRGGCSGGQ